MLDRRALMRLGLAAGSASLLPRSAHVARTSDLGPSPRVTPFLQSLPVPPVATRIAPFANTAPMPAAARGTPTFHEIVAEQRAVRLHPQLEPTLVWGYRDTATPTSNRMLGPTIVGRPDRPLVVRYKNELPRNHTGFGLTQTVVHWHGAHLPAASDGFPENVDGFAAVIGPGQSYDYALPNLEPGFLEGEPDPSDRPSTMWYHDHVLDYTAQNVYRGLAGMFLFFDELDTGDERTGLRLPSGDYDVPLVLQDRRLDARSQLAYDPLDHNGFLGDLWLVNGVVQPFCDVAARKYRFRLLNGCNARFLGVRVETANGTAVPFDVIATEGGLMSRTVRAQTFLLMSPALRYEIVVDFSRFAPGTRLYLVNRMDQPDGRGPRGEYDEPELLLRGDRWMEFRVGAPVEDASQVPDVLRPFAAPTAQQVRSARRRLLEFGRRNGVWVINGEAVDLERPIFTVPKGEAEVWTLKNGSGGWWHPIHVHSEFMQVVRRNGRAPGVLEQPGQARRDTIVLGPNDEVDVYLKFRDYPGRWVMHCHTIEHEDAFMMTCFDVE